MQYSQCQTGEQTGFYRCRRHVSGCRFTKVLSLADLRLSALSLDKLHGNVTIFRLLSTTHTHTGRQRTYADTARRFYGRAWKACSCCMIVNHGRVAAALGCLVVSQCVCVCVTCCMICCHVLLHMQQTAEATATAEVAIYGSPRCVCAIYEYFQKSQLFCTPPTHRCFVCI